MGKYGICHLVRSGERCIDQVPDVGMPFVHADAVAVLHGSTDLVDIAEVDLRVDALAIEVQTQCYQVHVARPLAVAEQASFDSIRSGQHRQLRVGDSRATVVVRVHGQGDVLAPREVAAHPFDLVGVDVWRAALDGARQVEDDLPVRSRLPHVHYRFADVQREVGLRVHEDFW
jgi:hypothetical protein